MERLQSPLTKRYNVLTKSIPKGCIRPTLKLGKFFFTFLDVASSSLVVQLQKVCTIFIFCSLYWQLGHSEQFLTI